MIGQIIKSGVRSLLGTVPMLTAQHGDAFVVGFTICLIVLCNLYGPHGFLQNIIATLPAWIVCIALISFLSYVDKKHRIRQRNKRMECVQNSLKKGDTGATQGGGITLD